MRLVSGRQKTGSRLSLTTRRALSALIFAILFISMLVVAETRSASAQVTACPQAAQAAKLVEAAKGDDAVADYAKAEQDYRSAARLYFECSQTAKTDSQRNEATYQYASALFQAARYDQDPLPLLRKVTSVTSALAAKAQYSLATKAVELNNAASKRLDDNKSKNTVATHLAIASASPTATPTSRQSQTCQTDLQAFLDAVESWRGAGNRYIVSTQNTNSAQPGSARPGMAWMSAAIYAGYEIKAIRSVIDAEEPKLAEAEQQIESDNLTDLQTYTSTIEFDIHTFDDYALTYSQNRYQYLQTLNSGGSPSQPDPTMGQRAHEGKLQIESDEQKLA